MEDRTNHKLILTIYLNWQFAKITKRWLDDSGNKNLEILLRAEDWANFEQLNLEQSTDHLTHNGGSRYSSPY